MCVLDADSGAVLAEQEPDRLLPTASVAKLFALVELAARLDSGELDADLVLDRREVDPVHDSGIWQHLRADALPVEDLAVLVASVSDNLATNVLLGRLGLERVQQRAAALAAGGSMLHDVVRDQRGPGAPEVLSTGCARDWAGFFAALHRGEVVSQAVSARLLRWTAVNCDLSMVASVLGLDPLAHQEEDHGLRLWSKTGTDAGVRADVGLVRGPAGVVAYAAICAWDDSAGAVSRSRVLERMRAVGDLVLAHTEAPRS
jgi:beta-lactamase class A